MTSFFKTELLKVVSEQSNPVIRTDSLAIKFKIKKEEVAKALLELKKEGEIFFIIKPDGDLYITHIDGTEIEWKVVEEEKEQELFDREGNLHIDVDIFFDTISQFPEVTVHETQILFEELSELEGEDYEKKILEIATKNIRLIRLSVFEVLQREALTEDELYLFYKMMISNFCRAVEKYDYRTPYTLKTYSAWWIFQASNRARSKIIQQWLDSEWGFTVGIQKIDEKTRDLKISLDRNPSYNEIYKAVEPLAKEKFDVSLEKVELIEDKHFHKIGINKLFTKVISSDITVEPSYEDKLRLESAIDNLDEWEIIIVSKRFGLENKSFQYGQTLEEIAQDFELTRERIRQIINDAVAKIKYYFKDQDLENDDIPFVFFPKSVQMFLKNNDLLFFSNILGRTKQDLLLLKGGTNTTVNKLIEIFETLGIYFEPTKKGEINFEELSVRAGNALIKQNISSEEELMNLNKEELEFIPNLGRKTIKEILKYQDKLKNNTKKQFSPEKVILFPCANPISQKNFTKTMERPHSLIKIKKHLLVNQYNDLKKIDKEFYFWGTKSGTDKKWQEIPDKSLALFFANKFAFSYGFVEYKLINQPLSDYFWGRDEQADKSYKYMFACSEVKETSIPQYIVNETLGYKENFVVKDFMVLNIKQSLDLLNLVNKYKFD